MVHGPGGGQVRWSKRGGMDQEVQTRGYDSGVQVIHDPSVGPVRLQVVYGPGKGAWVRGSGDS